MKIEFGTKALKFLSKIPEDDIILVFRVDKRSKVYGQFR
jgi:hypothetical protein